ncbi:hypothetical protein DFJ74DRAFT_672637 [Hyaloraphidium curvatum]|nr:hypothetical protein DFJ74DRAFT_672637 [Hyaloraphidium curvatum]
MVYPHLYLGTVNSICSDPDEFGAVEFLRQRNVTHILTVAGEIEDVPDIPKLEAALGRPLGWFHVVRASDTPGYRIITDFVDCYSFIEGALAPYYRALYEKSLADKEGGAPEGNPDLKKPVKRRSWLYRAWHEIKHDLPGLGRKNGPALPKGSKNASYLVKKGVERGNLNFPWLSHRSDSPGRSASPKGRPGSPGGGRAGSPSSARPGSPHQRANSPSEGRPVRPDTPNDPDDEEEDDGTDYPSQMEDHEAEHERVATLVKDYYAHPFEVKDLPDPLGEEGHMYPTVLVHCQMGISRSVTATTAHLLHLSAKFPDLLPLLLPTPDSIPPNATYQQALAYVQERRPVANPNPGFRKQLEAWQRMGSTRIKHDSQAWADLTGKQQEPSNKMLYVLTV